MTTPEAPETSTHLVESAFEQRVQQQIDAFSRARHSPSIYLHDADAHRDARIRRIGVATKLSGFLAGIPACFVATFTQQAPLMFSAGAGLIALVIAGEALSTKRPRTAILTTPARAALAASIRARTDARTADAPQAASDHIDDLCQRTHQAAITLEHLRLDAQGSTSQHATEALHASEVHRRLLRAAAEAVVLADLATERHRAAVHVAELEHDTAPSVAVASLLGAEVDEVRRVLDPAPHPTC